MGKVANPNPFAWEDSFLASNYRYIIERIRIVWIGLVIYNCYIRVQ